MQFFLVALDYFKLLCRWYLHGGFRLLIDYHSIRIKPVLIVSLLLVRKNAKPRVIVYDNDVYIHVLHLILFPPPRKSSF